MSTIRRTYTEKQKRALIRLARQVSTVKEAAQQQGIALSTANRWVADFHRGDAASRAARAEKSRRYRHTVRMQQALEAAVAPQSAAPPAPPPVPVPVSVAAEVAPATPAHLPDGGVILSADEQRVVLGLVRDALVSAKNPQMVREIAQLLVTLLP